MARVGKGGMGVAESSSHKVSHGVGAATVIYSYEYMMSHGPGGAEGEGEGGGAESNSHMMSHTKVSCHEMWGRGQRIAAQG